MGKYQIMQDKKKKTPFQTLRNLMDSVNIRKFLFALLAVVLFIILMGMILAVNHFLQRYAVGFAQEGAQLVRDQDLAEDIYDLAVDYINEQIRNLSFVISGIMVFAFILILVVLNVIFVNMVRAPLNRIGEKARRISENHQNLGEQIREPIFKEMKELTDAFNTMSTALADQVGELETRVKGRTAELEAAKEKIQEMAEHDSLTGLPNRRLLHEQFDKAVAPVGNKSEGIALLMIDLDNYKEINDSFGHLVGDEVLQEVGKRFQDVLRESDLITRWGGDEFVILLYNVSHDKDIEVVLKKLFSAFKKPITVDDHAFTIQMSVGIAEYPQDGNTMEQMMQCADTALYQAKKEAGHSYRFFLEGD